MRQLAGGAHIGLGQAARAAELTLVCVRKYVSSGQCPFKIGVLSVKGALYRIWCGVNRLGDSGVNVV